MNTPIALALVCLTTLSTTIVAFADDAKIASPDEAVQSRSANRVTVEFRVASVGVLTGLQGEGMPPHLQPLQLSAVPLSNGDQFYVVLNGKLLEDLERLGIAGADHFDGKTVRATGTIRAIALPAAQRTDYQMVVLDLDKFLIVK